MNLPNQIPARFVQIPAVPATRMAAGDESFTTTFVTPSTDATRFTGFEPVAESAMVAASAVVKPAAVAFSDGSAVPYVFVPSCAVTVAAAFVIVNTPATYVTS